MLSINLWATSPTPKAFPGFPNYPPLYRFSTVPIKLAVTEFREDLGGGWVVSSGVVGETPMNMGPVILGKSQQEVWHEGRKAAIMQPILYREFGYKHTLVQMPPATHESKLADLFCGSR